MEIHISTLLYSRIYGRKIVRTSFTDSFPLFSGQKYAFTFDKVFTQEASQNDVFSEISELVQSALDGYKVIY